MTCKKKIPELITHASSVYNNNDHNKKNCKRKKWQCRSVIYYLRVYVLIYSKPVFCQVSDRHTMCRVVPSGHHHPYICDEY